MKLQEECFGRWDDILPHFIPKQFLRNKHGPCPLCHGKDRFRYDNKTGNGDYICNVCGPGQGITLLMRYTEKPFKEIANDIRQILGTTKMTEPKADYDNTQENEAQIRKIIKSCKKLTPECVVARYLAGRGITVLPEINVYECWYVPYHEGKPAMVAVFRTPDGGISTIQITYLQEARVLLLDLWKVSKKERKFMPVIKPMAGSSIKLFDNKDSICAVCEGLETGCAIYMRDGIQVFAAGSANGMKTIELPDFIKTVWIYADSDKNFVGQEAAYALAKKLQLKGLEVRVCLLIDRELVVDSGDHFDFLDYIVLKDYEKQGSTS